MSVLLWAALACSTEPQVASRSEVDPARLEASVRVLTERFGPREAEFPTNLDAAAGWIRAELELNGHSVHETTWSADGKTFRNVSLTLGDVSAERIVIGAHYDVCGPYPGADDNASGVAALIELARLFATRPPPLGVELIAYSLEEPPYFRTEHMGSAVHARELAAQEVRVRAMLSLEMLGYYDAAPGSQRYPLGLLSWFYPDRGDFIAVVGNLGNVSLVRRVARGMRAAGGTVPVESIAAPALLSGIDFSDHRSFWEQGMPAVMITDTAFLRNASYHEDSDTPDSLDYGRMADVVEAIHAAIWALALED